MLVISKNVGRYTEDHTSNMARFESEAGTLDQDGQGFLPHLWIQIHDLVGQVDRSPRHR